MSYYWFNREKLLKKAWDKHHNKGGKQKATKYYRRNADLIKFQAKISIRNCQRKRRMKKESIKEKDITMMVI